MIPAVQRFLKADSPRKLYVGQEYGVSNPIHYGQRKLLLAEIEFLMLFMKTDSFRALKNPTVIYVGAAPGKHLLFFWKNIDTTKLRWILFDSASFHPDVIAFAKANPNRVTIVNDFFTEQTARQYCCPENPPIVISDLRIMRIQTDKEYQLQRVADLNLQRRIYEIIKPSAMSFKFALPYPEHADVPFFIGWPNDVQHVQCWAPHHSTETRLFVFGSDAKIRPYNCLVYEEQMAYYNDIVRKTEVELKDPILARHYDSIVTQDTLLEIKILSLLGNEHDGMMTSNIVRYASLIDRLLGTRPSPEHHFETDLMDATLIVSPHQADPIMINPVLTHSAVYETIRRLSMGCMVIPKLDLWKLACIKKMFPWIGELTQEHWIAPSSNMSQVSIPKKIEDCIILQRSLLITEPVLTAEDRSHLYIIHNYVERFISERIDRMTIRLFNAIEKIDAD